MTDTDSVQVSIRADVAQLVSGLKEAGGATRAATQEMQASLAGVHAGAREAGGGVFDLKEKLLEYGHHVRSEHRSTMLLAQQVAGLGIASKGAASEVTGLIAGFAFGGGLGLAVESVKAVAHIFGELAEEEKKAKEEMKKWADATTAETRRIQEAVTEELMTINGASRAEIAAHRDLAGLYKQRRELQDDQKQAERDLAAIKERTLVTERDTIQKIADENDALQRQADAKEKLATLNREIMQRTEAVVQIGNAEHEKNAKDAADRDAARDEALYAKKIKLLEEHYKQKQKFLAEQDKAEGEASKKIEEYNRHLNEEWFKEEVRKEKAEAEAEKKRAEGRKKEVDELARDLDRAGKQMAATLVSIVDGTKSVSQAMGDLAKKLATDVLDGLIKIGAQHLANAAIAKSTTATVAAVNKAAAISSTEGNIAISASEAATAVAWLGPEAAAAAFAATTAALQAQATPLLSAAGGIDRVPKDGTLAVLHKDEQVWPAAFANRVSSMLDRADASGGGGSSVTVHFNAPVDAQWWRSNEGHVVRVIQEATRKGRL